MSKVVINSCECGCDEKRSLLMEVTPLTAEEVELALEYIRQGWIQGTLTDGKGNYCSVGALNKARFGDHKIQWGTDTVCGDYQQSLDEFGKLLELEEPEVYSLTSWNDDKLRTKQQVEDGFLLVAKKLRDQGRS